MIIGVTCRYLSEDRTTGKVRCAYWDDPLLGDEDLRCHPGGHECYEAPSGWGKVIPWGTEPGDGPMWVSLEEFVDRLKEQAHADLRTVTKIPDYDPRSQAGEDWRSQG